MLLPYISIPSERPFRTSKFLDTSSGKKAEQSVTQSMSPAERLYTGAVTVGKQPLADQKSSTKLGQENRAERELCTYVSERKEQVV